MYQRESQREGERQRISHLLVYSLYLQQYGLGQTKAKGLPDAWQALTYFSFWLLLFQVYISRKVKSQQSQNWNPCILT